MDNLIERYVYDVIRRLPEKDRDEVSKELKSNIYDMLPENADENARKMVLYNLGSPASLAEKYRQKPRYLISPAVYDDYVRVLKWVLPLVGVVVLVIGMILGAIDAIKDGMVDLPYLMSNIFSKGIAMGISAVFQALIWTTVGFVIADRTGAKSDKSKEQEWKIEDLPEALPDDKGKIKLSDSIAELVLTVVFSILGILICRGVLPIAFVILNGDTQIRTLFSPSFLASCVPAIAVMAILGVGACIFKIKVRRWTPIVCGAVVVSTIINMCIMIYLFNRPDLFSAEFIAFLQSVDWSSFDLLSFMGASGPNLFVVFISIVIVVCSLAECGQAIYRTLKYKKPQ
ncbi:hypothetical protein [Desulfitobacterium chlororespirans]|uniref:Uncharacterized protein n=1 Tax=Desulfitobacterium chlororespirans DSM 11544 TaxID=1121395 RepID=A0A1M7TWG4_9FIRM|nr:hypothetical protein [Desulfitobacterium chlororespirans]SHN75047.1 hypothetical protein SAMN02745215_02608 [Desulfitobacterium chlororespirans DSM 11544]